MAADRFLTTVEAREILCRAYRSDSEINIGTVIHRALSDPTKPVSEKGRTRPSIFVVVGGIMVFLIVAGFVYFSVGGPQ